MVDTKEIVDIFLKSEITTISNFDSYKVSRLGGITNVNFKVEIGSQKFVLRLPGKNPDTSLNREAEKNNQLVAVEAGLTLPFLYFDVDSGVNIRNNTTNIAQFGSDVKYEMSKVSWPGWEDLKGSTYVVLILSLIITSYLFVVDFVLSRAISIVM